MRRIFTYVLAAIVAAFLWVLVTVPSVHAADATWNSPTSIEYSGDTYNGPANAETVENLDLLKGTKVYTYVEPTPQRTNANANDPRLIHVIYFASDTDASVATGAKYKTYIYQGPDSFADPSTPTNISMDQSGSTSEGTTSCAIDGGIGWIVCPITNFLATGMDWIFDALSGFLAVRPVETGQDNALHRAWTYIQGFANIAFVIAFLIIIYSQLTNLGINNYSIKKLLPRLIIAAVLVNLSYYICAIAVDISNILGYAVQDVFINIRNNLVGSEGNSWEVLSWESISGFILSGGTLAAAGTIGAISVASTYGIGGAIMLLLPSLLIGLLAVLVALLIMAGRQAIITILIILAPLAFVAYLLPNTEKWFEKWRSLFMTMLILFPAFSVVFGGSQLAATAIIQNADSINLIILGMLVQVAPLFITPLLIRLSGSILGKVAGLVNNPNRGVVDRARKFAEDRTGNIAARRLGQATKPHQFLRRNAQRIDHNRRKREAWKSTHTGMADARWANSQDFSNIDQQARESADVKSLGETRSELRYTGQKVTNTQLRSLDTNLRDTKLRVENAKLGTDIQWEQNTSSQIAQQKMLFRTLTDKNASLKSAADTTYEVQKTAAYRKTPEYKAQSATMRSLIDDARITAEDIAIQAIRTQSAKHVQQHDLATALEQSASLREEAGAAIIDKNGAQRSLASAITVIKKAHAETIANADAVIERGNLSDDMTLELALGANQVGSNGRVIEATDDMIEAAVTRVASSGNVKNIIALSERLDLSTLSDEDHRVALVESLKRNSAGRPKFFGFGWMGQVAQGVEGGIGPDGVDMAIRDTINAKKLSADVIVTQDKDALARILQTITNKGTGYFNADALQNFKKQITQAYEMDEYKGRIAERDDELKAILEKIS